MIRFLRHPTRTTCREETLIDTTRRNQRITFALTLASNVHTSALWSLQRRIASAAMAHRRPIQHSAAPPFSLPVFHTIYFNYLALRILLISISSPLLTTAGVLLSLTYTHYYLPLFNRINRFTLIPCPSPSLPTLPQRTIHLSCCLTN